MTEFLNLDYLKSTIPIKNIKSDERLLEIVSDANNEIDKILSPYAETTPIPTGGNLFVKCRLLAAIYGRMRWYRNTGQLDRAEAESQEFEMKKESFIKLFESQRTSRREVVIISERDALEQVYNPYNVDEYLTREF